MSEKVSKSRAERCVTHHYACDCREYRYQEMLKALERSKSHFRELLEGNYLNMHEEEMLVDWIDELDAAIKKARGE
jgi:uncharacterized protein YdcH (DUF465 family)